MNLEPLRLAITKWWRPATCVGMAVTVWTQGVALPMTTKTYPDLGGLAALFTAVVAAFAVREFAKTRGTPQ
jgi:hypothetical protein